MKEKLNSIYWNLLFDVIIAVALLLVFFITAKLKLFYDGHYQWPDYSVYILILLFGVHALLQLVLFFYNILKQRYKQALYFVVMGAFVIFITKWIVLTFLTLRLGGTPTKPVKMHDKRPTEKKKEPVQDIRRRGELV